MTELRVFKDKQGRSYFNIYLPFTTEAAVSFKNEVKTFKGSPKLTLRKGNSKFGDQILLQLNISEQLEHYQQKSVHNTLEIYIPAEQFEELKKAILILESSL